MTSDLSDNRMYFKVLKWKPFIQKNVSAVNNILSCEFLVAKEENAKVEAQEAKDASKVIVSALKEIWFICNGLKSFKLRD